MQEFFFRKNLANYIFQQGAIANLKRINSCLFEDIFSLNRSISLIQIKAIEEIVLSIWLQANLVALYKRIQLDNQTI